MLLIAAKSLSKYLSVTKCVNVCWYQRSISNESHLAIIVVMEHFSCRVVNSVGTFEPLSANVITCNGAEPRPRHEACCHNTSERR